MEKTNEDRQKQLVAAITYVTAGINITNSYLKKESASFKRNEKTKKDVVNCLKKQILMLKKIDNKG